MNDFVRNLIKSVSQLEKASAIETIIIFEEIIRKYDEHVKFIRENDFDRRSLMSELSELKRLEKVHEDAHKLKWEQSFMLGNEIFISKNTFLFCVIRESDTIGYRLTTVDRRDSTTHVNMCQSVNDCKKKASDIHKESINK